MKRNWLASVMALAIVGCTPPAAPTTGAPKDTVVSKTVPDELRHDGFSYYGLANEKPMFMEIIRSSQPEVVTGAQTNVLNKVEGGKAFYTIERTGNLSSIGSQVVAVESDGVYVTESKLAKVNHDLELPAKLGPGVTWNNKMIVDQPGTQMNLDLNFKVEGERDIKTKVGARKALLITSTGEGTLRGQKVKMTMENWHVRDIGVVRAVSKIISPNGKTETVTIQEIPE